MKKLILVLILLGCINIAYAYNMSSSDYQAKVVIDSGSDKINSTNYNMSVSVEKEPIGSINSTNYKLKLGSFDYLAGDTTKPNIQLNYPIPGYTSSSATVLFSFNVTDENIDYCYLYFSNVNSKTIATPSTSAENAFSYGTLVMIGAKTWFIRCFDKFSNFNDSETRIINFNVQNPSGGASGSTYFERCYINITPLNLYINQKRLTDVFTINNTLNRPLFVQVNVPMVPTVFGTKNIIELSQNNFLLSKGAITNISISLSDFSDIRSNTTIYLDVFEYSGCRQNVTLHIAEFPPTMYDVKVSTNRLLYSIKDIVNVKVSLINMGDVPDRDSILKLYIIDTKGNKTYFSNEVLKEVGLGTTNLLYTYFLEQTNLVGKYTVGVEYDTEGQGLLLASTIFFIIPIKYNLFLIIIITLFFIVTLLPLWFFLVKRRKREDE